MSKRKKFLDAAKEFLTKDTPRISPVVAETPRSAVAIRGGVTHVIGEIPPKTFPVGYRMQDALEKSFYLHRAYRSYDATAGLMTDGFKFWLVDTETLEAQQASQIFVNMEAERDRMDWRPVYGNERGWTLECRS